ncbi:MAG TPA: GDP-L-fucose synthase [Polyangiales bacterium]|nr:GDP-L-fucose synthase [Polyangiales bacterium]
MNLNDKIFVTGHRGMVGSALRRALQARGHQNLLLAAKGELDLRDSAATRAYFAKHKPSVVFLAAAKVGGIEANRAQPAEFLYDNLMIQNNVIHSAHEHGARELVFLGSSCVYPRECPQPIKEEYLLTGPLEPTNEGYALAKIAGIRLCQYYAKQHGLRVLAVMPCNLYGPNDSFDLAKCHVLSALVRRFVDAAKANAPQVTLWGSGVARREFLHVDDLARGVLHALEHWQSPELLNIGSGEDLTIKELAGKVSAAAGYHGAIAWDTTRPDGMPRKCMDVTHMKAMGFSPTIALDRGIDEMIGLYRALEARGDFA